MPNDISVFILTLQNYNDIKRDIFHKLYITEKNAFLWIFQSTTTTINKTPKCGYNLCVNMVNTKYKNDKIQWKYNNENTTKKFTVNNIYQQQ